MTAQEIVEALVRIGKCNDRTDNQDLCITRELKAAHAAGYKAGMERMQEIYEAGGGDAAIVAAIRAEIAVASAN